MRLFHLAVTRSLYGVFTRWLASRFPSGTSVALELPTGLAFRISLDDAYWTRFALYHNPYEPEIARVLDACAGHAPLFCDVGANKGYWSVYAAPIFDQVVAIEASSATFRILTENTRDVPNVTRRWAAAFRESNRELSFHNVDGSHVSGHISKNKDENARGETVESVALDDLLPPKKLAVIKLDVEGAERDAIHGARRAISEGALLIYEDHGADFSCSASAALFELGDISVYSIENTPHCLNSVDDVRRIKTDKYKGYNFLAARGDAHLLKLVIRSFANR